MSGPCYSRRLDEAVALALSDFRDARRKATPIPYVTHLLQVMVWVGEHGGDEDQLIAAVLHDWLEDVEHGSAEELERRFGARVRRLVEALSDATERPKPPWWERKQRYLAHLRTQPAEVRLISAADKLHNAESVVRDLRAVGPEVFERFTTGREGTLWYYEAVHEALADGWEHPLLERLEAAVSRMQALAE